MNSTILENTYRGKKVFLTGHTGFKGAWLLKWLHLLGAEIKGYALAPETTEDLYTLINGDKLCESIIGDIKDLERLKEEIKIFEPDFIFHLAAQPLVRLSYEIPLETFQINGNGSGNVLEAVRYLEKPCVVVMITTDKVYHNLEKDYGYQEEDKLGGYDPYSASKAVAEIIIDSYRKSFFNPDKYNEHQKSISVGRAGNVIGGGDWAKDRIIPDIVKALAKGEKIIVRNPNAVRPWQHVLEPLSGYLTLAAMQVIEPVRFAKAYNFGPELTDNLKVSDLVNIAITKWGSGTFKNQIDKNALHEAKLLQLDISKAKRELEWTPKWQAKKAIDETIAWYISYYSEGNNISEYTEASIKKFSKL